MKGTMHQPVLRYIGNGRAMRGIPARDLYEAEIEALELEHPEAGDIAQILADSGLYEWAAKYSPRKEKEACR